MRDIHFTAGILPNRALFYVEGPDAGHFLHNLVTADIEGLAPGQAAYTALLTPQGKVLHDFFVLNAGERYLIDCAASQRAELVKRLGFYKLRAKVTVSPSEDEVAVAMERPSSPLAFADPRSAALGWRFAVPAGSLADNVDYESARIAIGLGDSGADIGSGELFPHEANLDQLGGVSFKKGCYVGQEVVSRMEHRGTARSRILPVALDGEGPAKGAEIRSGEKLVGTLLSASGSAGLALIRLDRLAEASAPLLTEGVTVHVLKPRWASYDVPGSEGVA